MRANNIVQSWREVCYVGQFNNMQIGALVKVVSNGRTTYNRYIQY